MKKNDFGYKKVDQDEHYNKVQQVFNNVASKYDLMNDLMSLGLQRSWKKEFINMINITNEGQIKVIDLAGGTGDIAIRLKEKFPESSIRIIDKNFNMLKEGIKRENNILKKDIKFLCGDGENIPMKDNSIDLITISFGIRNMTDRNKCLEECYRVLRPNGTFMCMEFSMPENYTLRNLYDAWSFFIIPKLGQLVSESEDSYRYLVESIRKFPKPDDFVKLLESNNFKKISIKQLSGNIVCIYKGKKYNE